MGWLLVGGWLLAHAAWPAAQAPRLRVVTAAPMGDIGELADANEIRITFSEPMIAVGATPTSPTVSWMSISPAVKGAYYWSGTRTLIFTPDPEQRLPYATRFTVTIDAAARAASGRELGERHQFSFMTPAVRLLSADWYRKSGRASDPVLIALRFNQPVRPADVVAHTSLRAVAHPWTMLATLSEQQRLLSRVDPAARAKLDDKVARARAAAAATHAVPVQIAPVWDLERFPRSDALVVLETTDPPPPDTWLRVTVAETMPSPDGPERHPTQSSVVQLEQTFFVERLSCVSGCDPENPATVQFRRGVDRDDFAAALSVRDVTGGGNGPPVDKRADAGVSAGGYRPAGGFPYHDPYSAGYPRQPPLTTWHLELDESLRSADGQTLGYRWIGAIETSHLRPHAFLTGGVLESALARADPQVPFVARNVTEVRSWAERTPRADIFRYLEELRSGRVSVPFTVESRRLKIAPDAFDGHGIDLRRVLSPAATALAWVGVDTRDILPASLDRRAMPGPRAALLQVTNLGITAKDAPGSTLIFVTRLDTAAPVAGARVAIVDTTSRERWRGVTNADGVAIAPIPSPRRAGDAWQLSHIVTAEHDGDFAFVASSASGDVSPAAFGLYANPGESGGVLRASIITDRGVYRQGDEVQLKAIVRADTTSGMEVASGRLDVVIRDARGQEVDRRTVPINEWSSAGWSWRVPADGSLGTYAVTVGLASDGGDVAARPNHRRVTRTFLVAAFRRPDFRVDATLTATTPTLGTPLDGRIDARYLFGAPLAKQPVRWRLSSYARHLIPAAIHERYSSRQYAFGAPPRPELSDEARYRVIERTEPLSADGHVSPSLPTAAGDDTARVFTFEGDVEGVSGQHIANRASLTVHPASFYVGVERPPMFFDPRKGGSVAILAANLDGTPRLDVPVTLSIVREEWVQARPDANNQFQSWERREIPVGEWRVTTSAGGVRLPITLSEGGCYLLRAVAQDEQQRPTRTEVTFYVIAPGRSAWKSEGNRIELTPERRTWAPGETARILVQSPWERATALVTVEREGIRSHRRVEIMSMQDTIDVPITEREIPNVFVSVLLVKGRTSSDLTADGGDPGAPGFRVGYTELTVDDASKRLRVDVRADREDYRPREQVRVSVAVRDPAGAAASGRQEVTLWAMDHGLLSLTAYTVPDVARAIYARKSLQVVTTDNRAGLIRRLPMSETKAPVAGGAGGGGRGGQAFGTRDSTIFGLPETMTVHASAELVTPPPAPSTPPPPGQPAVEVRSDFRPLVFWIGSTTTDTSGRATTTVTLPDSLTTYRIMAVAGSRDSRFGAGEAEIRASKPLTLLPAFPRFLAVGDRATFGAVVTNNMSAGGDAVVIVESLGAGHVQFGDVTSRRLRLAPGESAPVRFDATARSAGSARLRMIVTLGAEADAFEMPLPVIVPAPLTTTAAYGETVASAIEKLMLPAGIAPHAGGLTVSLASTALVGLDASARYLDDYAHACAEQKASRALALLLSADLEGAFGLNGATPDAHRATARRLLSDLYGYQCGDGGFALFPTQCRSSAYLTAYILHVYKLAETLREQVDRRVVDRALNFLQAQLKQPPPEVSWLPAWAASNAYAVKVLAEFGRKPAAEITQLHARAETMPTFALSYLADALAAIGDRGARYQDVVRRISNKVAISADRAHVEEMDDASLVWLWNSNVRATAVVLSGFARRGDDPTFVAPLARWLLSVREQGRWRTTQENAVALEALVAYYRAFESEVPQMQATVTLAGRDIGRASFAGRSTAAQEVRVAMPELVRQLSSEAARDLVVSRSGTGRLFYTARLQYLAPPSPEPEDRGIRVDRRFERFDPSAAAGPGEPLTSFVIGDLVRVRLVVTLPHEGRFLAITDPLAAGFEPVDGTLKTTALDLAQQATSQSSGRNWRSWFRAGGFDHIEKHDDRVVAYATRLAAGRHDFTYLVRATTAGSFGVAGTRAEAMYAPEVGGRGAAQRVEVR